uniref:Uncharacterized protein n=1 Tax=Peronospora matthiolae TaxID=2874970 RepID=A0AAV1UA10_9STRA
MRDGSCFADVSSSGSLPPAATVDVAMFNDVLFPQNVFQ